MSHFYKGIINGYRIDPLNNIYKILISNHKQHYLFRIAPTIFNVFKAKNWHLHHK